MAAHTLSPATSRDLDLLWPAVRAAHIFPSKSAFAAFHAEAPWRVRVSPAGAAAVVERWREGSDLLAIRGLWCAENAIPGFIGDLTALAQAHGFTRLLSPLVPADGARAYTRAGMGVAERLVSLRLDRSGASALTAAPPASVRIRRATPADAPVLDEIDRACFDAFWSYGTERIARYIAEERVAVACADDAGPIGYTLCTVERGSGTLGRLAVRPEHRRMGVGAYLVADAVEAMLRDGAAAVTLCTQEENSGARALYSSLGFRELPGGLVLLVCDV